MKRVLAIDGGGIRGRLTVRFLAEFEKRSGKRIHEMFDLIAGVSTGGIIACMLATSAGPYYAAEIEKFYVEDGPSIFDAGLGRKILTLGGLVGNHYSDYGLRHALESKLKNSRLCDTVVPILVSAFDIEHNESYFFKTSKVQAGKQTCFALHDVAWATSAAPTYFDPAVIPCDSDGGHLALCDGGVFATNPAMCAYAEASEMWPNDPINLVSVGTGDVKTNRNYKTFMHAGDAQWVISLLDMMLAGSSETVDHQMGELPLQSYFRFNRILQWANPAMDDASGINMNNLAREADRMIDENTTRIDEVLKILLP